MLTSRRVHLLVGLLIALSACSTTSSHQSKSTEASSPSKSTTIPIHFEVSGKPFPIPLVKGSIDGQKVLLMLDSGSNAHVLAQWFVDKYDFEKLSKESSGDDYTGEKMVLKHLEPFNVVLRDFESTVSDGLMTKLPKPFRQLRIAGILSPQNLIQHESVSMDFPKQKMTITEGLRKDIPEASRGLGKGARRIVVPTRVEGYPETKGLIDTGSSHTTISKGYVKKNNKSSDKDCAVGVGASGECVDAQKHTFDRIDVAGSRFKDVDVGLKPAKKKPYQAVIGIPLLRQCQLDIFQKDEIYYRMQCASEKS